MPSDIPESPARSPDPSLPTEPDFAASLRGFGPYGLIAIVVIVIAPTPLLKAMLILIWAKWSKTPWREIGFASPPNWAVVVVAGITFGVVFKLVMKAGVMPLLGAPDLNPAYHFLAGNPGALPLMLFRVIAGGGFGEETAFRGYLFERLGKLFGTSVSAKVAMVVITTTLFALAHFRDQGTPGVEQAIFTGVVFGTVFAITGRLWLVMIAHAVFDLTAVALIYWNIEGQVAHWIFQ